MDEDFMKLSDNEQIAWLESLFFLDTPSKKASSGLVKPRPREEINQNSSRRPSTLPASKVDTSSISSVSSKSLSIQSNSGRTPNATRDQQPTNTNANYATSTAVANDTEEVDNCPPGLNKDKCALAMSFFNNDSKGAKKPSAKKTSKKSSNGNANDLPNVTNAIAKPFAKSSPPERAYYEPDADLLPVEDEDEDEDLEEVFQTRVNSRKNRQPPELEHAPPVPERSGEPKAMMMRLMKNATNIMRS